MKATWAVACLLTVLPMALGGCATDRAAETKSRPAGYYNKSAEASKVVGADNSFEQPARETPVAYSGPAYRLGAEDQIRVSVWETPSLTMDLVVRPDGKISMPLVQDIVAEGLTAGELGKSIREKLLVYIKDPHVSVIVLQVNAPKYFVIGNVMRPGTYPLRSETSVLQGLALAGGFTTFASPRSIKLVRNTDGRQEVRKLNYYRLLEEEGEGNYVLKSGDTIVVP